ncbi:hypothetical protein AVEN_133751-1 [Araneus ventricosus]|uniref:Uncharacterized protein n=1 Tax=Araneus ventricosus TaxID=182803 RepID=A0A4Y2B8K7_ARAVE|nr:hypothetical protein AVEN_133751-1 [Araneus ventricosus]
MLYTEKWKKAYEQQQAPLRRLSIRDMSTVESDTAFNTLCQALRNIIQQLLRQFLHFSVSAWMRVFLFAGGYFRPGNRLPKASQAFSIVFRSDYMLAMRGVEYPRCLDNLEE